jgi:hypothetical protein
MVAWVTALIEARDMIPRMIAAIGKIGKIRKINLRK